eukprot:TRINITY_DN1877_c0_g1_i22.p2 TRINITY_DN1877_c0_g1~~TRINITY_DN1877_c0_g1_i22.p2  ORF type:complete len:121 (-),score=1.27 TRINITY_DN1877_c0_g1_i22:234-596(-)
MCIRDRSKLAYIRQKTVDFAMGALVMDQTDKEIWQSISTFPIMGLPMRIIVLILNVVLPGISLANTRRWYSSDWTLRFQTSLKDATSNRNTSICEFLDNSGIHLVDHLGDTCDAQERPEQ